MFMLLVLRLARAGEICESQGLEGKKNPVSGEVYEEFQCELVKAVEDACRGNPLVPGGAGQSTTFQVELAWAVNGARREDLWHSLLIDLRSRYLLANAVVQSLADYERGWRSFFVKHRGESVGGPALAHFSSLYGDMGKSSTCRAQLHEIMKRTCAPGELESCESSANALESAVCPALEPGAVPELGQDLAWLEKVKPCGAIVPPGP